MNILSIGSPYYESSIVLIEGGRITYALEEERFSRIKKDRDFPIGCINHIESVYGFDLSQLDGIAIACESPSQLPEKFKQLADMYNPEEHTYSNFGNFNELSTNLKFRTDLENFLKSRDINPQIIHTNHHLSHAASFYVSGLKKATVFTSDGQGDLISSTVTLGEENNNLEVLKTYLFDKSVAHIYGDITCYLGLKKFNDEGKVMAMASLGNKECKIDIINSQTSEFALNRFSENLFSRNNIKLKKDFYLNPFLRINAYPLTSFPRFNFNNAHILKNSFLDELDLSSIFHSYSMCNKINLNDNEFFWFFLELRNNKTAPLKEILRNAYFKHKLSLKTSKESCLISVLNDVSFILEALSNNTLKKFFREINNKNTFGEIFNKLKVKDLALKQKIMNFCLSLNQCKITYPIDPLFIDMIKRKDKYLDDDYKEFEGRAIKDFLELVKIKVIDLFDSGLKGDNLITPLQANLFSHFLLTENYREDIAFTTQKQLEKLMAKWISFWMGKTKHTDIFLSGGLFLNIKLNKIIRDLNCNGSTYVFPAASDNGTSFGSAILAYRQLYNQEHGRYPSFNKLEHMYYGSSYGDDDVKLCLDKFKDKLDFSKISDPSAVGAELISKGDIIGWFQDKMEFGPRALGNRSILADPTKTKSSLRLNSILKRREWFQPYCPTILDRAEEEYLENPTEAPFMIMAFDVKPEKQKEIPSVTFVDGTVRPQILKKEVNPLFYDLIENFENMSGVPLVLNTSFNVHREPIVEHPTQALNILLNKGIDKLIINNFLVKRKK